MYIKKKKVWPTCKFPASLLIGYRTYGRSTVILRGLYNWQTSSASMCIQHLFIQVYIYTHTCTRSHARVRTHTQQKRSSNHHLPTPSLWHRVGRAHWEEYCDWWFRSKAPHFSSPAHIHSAALPLRNGWVSAVSFPMHLLTIPKTPSLKQKLMSWAGHCYGPPRM